MGRYKVLVDGDIIAYRAAFSTQDLMPKDATNKVEDLLSYILEQTVLFPEPDDYQIYLTGKGNFRYDIAKSHEYKGHRKKTEKPRHLEYVRQHLMKNHNAIMSDGEEADDLIAIEATRLGPDTIVASIDKDMLQIPCRHYNFNKNLWTDVNEWDGLKFFYSQILMGDAADNIIGLYKVGPVKANKMLEGCTTEQEMYDRCVAAYSNDEGRVIENARLLWLRRQEGELWQPPNMR